MRRFLQFSLKGLLIAVFGVACFSGGMSLQRRLDRPVMVNRVPSQSSSSSKGLRTGWNETIRLSDGTEWQRLNTEGVLQDETEATIWMMQGGKTKPPDAAQELIRQALNDAHKQAKTEPGEL